MWGLAIAAFLAIRAVVAPRKPKWPKTNSAASRMFASISGPGAGFRPPLGDWRIRNAFKSSYGIASFFALADAPKRSDQPPAIALSEGYTQSRVKDAAGRSRLG